MNYRTPSTAKHQSDTPQKDPMRHAHPYTSPALTLIGTMSDLTSGGSGTKRESNKNTDEGGKGGKGKRYGGIVFPSVHAAKGKAKKKRP